MTLRTWAEWQAQREERQEAWCRETFRERRAPDPQRHTRWAPGAQARQARRMAGLNQAEAAALLGVSQKWVSAIETGGHRGPKAQAWAQRVVEAMALVEHAAAQG